MDKSEFRTYILEDHPRPDYARPDWVSLNGDWEFSFDRKKMGESSRWFAREGFPYRIKVPFPVESELSGIGLKRPPEVCWYLRRFDLPGAWKERRVRLNFGAVDYRAKVWLNNTYLGEHTGGYTPFGFDITESLLNSDNKLILRVSDPRTIYQVRGKQTFMRKSRSIFYTTVTGIWQPVWMEAGGVGRIESLVINAAPSGEVNIRYGLEGSVEGCRLDFLIYGPDGEEVIEKTESEVSREEGRISFRIENPRLWQPGEGKLYPLQVKLTDAEGQVSDEVRTYFGLREVEACDGAVFINGEKFYHRFLLNQGYFPDGVYRPGDPERYRRDVQDVLEMGFNGLRMHQKVEDPAFLYWCDALGAPVWAEMPSYLLPKKRCQAGFREQWRDAMLRDINHPCVIAWVPFNEQWGVQDVWLSSRRKKFFREVLEDTRRIDSTRPVVANSGWEHEGSDILDQHTYARNIKVLGKVLENLGGDEGRSFGLRKSLFLGGKNGWPFFTKPLLAPGEKYRGQPIIISEYGGFGFYPTQEKSLIENFTEYTLAIAEAPHIAGYCYTQQYDTEQEKNGLLTYDRKPKVDILEVKRVNGQVEETVRKRGF